MTIRDVENTLREIRDFQFEQSGSVYDVKRRGDTDDCAVYGTGISSEKGHFYGLYTINRLSSWLLHEADRHKINGLHIREFYETRPCLCLSASDVLDVL